MPWDVGVRFTSTNYHTTWFSERSENLLCIEDHLVHISVGAPRATTDICERRINCSLNSIAQSFALTSICRGALNYGRGSCSAPTTIIFISSSCGHVVQQIM